MFRKKKHKASYPRSRTWLGFKNFWYFLGFSLWLLLFFVDPDFLPENIKEAVAILHISLGVFACVIVMVLRPLRNFAQKLIFSSQIMGWHLYKTTVFIENSYWFLCGNSWLALCSMDEDARFCVLFDKKIGVSKFNCFLDGCRRFKYIELEGCERTNFCSTMARLGFYSEAIGHGEAALLIATQYNDLELEASACGNLGEVYRLISNPTKAIELYTRQLNLEIERDNQLGQASAYNNLGNVLDKLDGRWQEALEMYKQALDIYIATKNLSGQATIYTNMGSIFQTHEQLQKAIKYHCNALEVARSIKDRSTEVTALLNLGYCYFGIENFSASLNHFQSALPLAQEQKHRRKEVKALSGSADCYCALNHFEKAKFYYQQAIPHLEIMQEGLDLADRRSLIKEYLEIYQSLVEVCIQSGDLTAAFFYSESYRNRYLVEKLKRYNASFPEELPDALIQEIELAQQQERTSLKAYTDGLSKNFDPQKLSTLNTQWSKSKTNLERLYQRVESVKPEFVATTKVYPVSFYEAQSLLPSDTAIIEFFLTNKRLVTIVILPDEESPLIPSDLCLVVKQMYLESIAKSWIADITSKTTSKKEGEMEEIIQDFPRTVDRISELIRIENLSKYIPEAIKNLIIVPHNYLNLFPIHALWINDRQRIIDRFSVQYFPNLQIWKICQNRQRNHWRLIAVENPTQDKDLIFGKAEVASICERRYFVDSTVLKEETVSKTAILKAVEDYECFHFSGHAEYNFDSPLNSYLMINEENDNENITLNTVLVDVHMPKADLVSLSACCTGVVDAFQPTDDCIGLSSGFILAGAKAVISSQWKVNSIATAFLFDEFYRQLEASGNKALALQKAQNWLRTCTSDELQERVEEWDLSMLEFNERIRLEAALDSLAEIPFQNPYYWAAFILTGC